MRVMSLEELDVFAKVGKAYPSLVELLKQYRQDELETLAQTHKDFFDTQKGRVSMLTEILKHLKP